MARNTIMTAGLLLTLCSCAFATGLLAIWLDVPFVKQEKNGCGPASIAMVMQYWQKQMGAGAQPSADVTQIAHSLQPSERQDVRASEMVRYFMQNGYQAFAFAGEWADLERELAKGRPVIAAIKPENSRSLHYVVIVGVDDQERVVLLNDPAQRKRLKEDRSRFEQEWKVAGFWTLLAVPAAH